MANLDNLLGKRKIRLPYDRYLEIFVWGDTKSLQKYCVSTHGGRKTGFDARYHSVGGEQWVINFDPDRKETEFGLTQKHKKGKFGEVHVTGGREVYGLFAHELTHFLINWADAYGWVLHWGDGHPYEESSASLIGYCTDEFSNWFIEKILHKAATVNA